VEQSRYPAFLYYDTHTPAPTPDVYKRRCEQQDVLIADKGTYVWGYAGKLNKSQSKVVQTRLSLAFADRFYEWWEDSGGSSATPYGFEFGFKIADRKPGTLDCLARLSPDLEFLSYVSPLYHNFMFYPKRSETSEVFTTLRFLPEQDNPGFYWYRHRLEVSKTHMSFVKLLSWKEIMVGWDHAEYCSGMDILRHTAATWVIYGTLRNGFKMKLKRDAPLGQDIMKEIFQMLVQDDKEYIPSLKFLQLVVLGECVDIVNSIRKADGCRDKNIDNVYEVIIKRREQIPRIVRNDGFASRQQRPKRMSAKDRRALEHARAQSHTSSAFPPQTQVADDLVVPSVNINENITAPIAELNKLPVAPETVTEQGDILDDFDETNGRWVSQEEYQNHTGYKKNSLNSYRETKKGAVFSKKAPRVGMDKPGNFFRKVNNKPNSPYEYFLRNSQNSTDDE
jgi:hypothetical protein